MNGLALCSGYGGIDLGLRLALGDAYRTVCHVERETYVAEVLAARMEEGHLNMAPIWDDLATFDGARWRGTVDIVTAGFPCQPVSVAGKQAAQDDARWLWPEVARVVREVDPGWVFLENVPGLLVHAFGDVLRDLAELGFDAEWGVFSAAGSGAPHLRRRVFILAANPEVEGLEGRRQGLPELGPWRTTEPPVLRGHDAAPNRVDRLRAIGNGVVPSVAARAFVELTRRKDNHEQSTNPHGMA